MYFRRLTENGQGDLLVTFPLGPFKTPVTFLVDTGAQMSALNSNTADRSGIVPDKKRIWVTDVFGYSKPQLMARVKCWLTGDTTPTEATMILGTPANSLGLDLLKGKAWTDSAGRKWKFGSPATLIRLLQTAAALPLSKIVNVTMAVTLLPGWSRSGTSTTSPTNSN